MIAGSNLAIVNFLGSENKFVESMVHMREELRFDG